EPASEAELAAATPIVRRNVDVLRDFAARDPAGKPRAVRLRFRVSPVAIHGGERVEAVEIVRNELVADEAGRVRAVPADLRERIVCGLVFRSVGYLGVPVPGIAFDERRGTIANAGGRVLDAHGTPVPGVYCAGWIKRGPTGIIGTNKKDAAETVALLLEDAAAGRLPAADRSRTLESLVAERGVEAVVYAGWQAIDVLERTRGGELGRPRVKLCSWDELLAAARGAVAVE
ncbi:MAG: hypothetical protein ICV64_03395, partial [Thermoleophilia bacterium]|nr:hypothetical protein [Thermoleophilia bacterium]